MTTERTETGLEIEGALGEILAHVRGETALSCRIMDDPSAGRIVELRKRMKLSRQKFADRFGLDARAVQDWEQGRRVPDRAARVLLTVIDRDPEAVIRALSPPLSPSPAPDDRGLSKQQACRTSNSGQRRLRPVHVAGTVPHSDHSIYPTPVQDWTARLPGHFRLLPIGISRRAYLSRMI